MKIHQYNATINWTGNKGVGTKTYNSYGRNHTLKVAGKHVIEVSSDPAFLGDATRYNPEELFVASLSSCHMLWYLHLCTQHDIVVLTYTDECRGEMTEEENGSGRFTNVSLFPSVTVENEAMIHKANELHAMAHEMCFIANSCNFPVKISPVCEASK